MNRLFAGPLFFAVALSALGQATPARLQFSLDRPAAPSIQYTVTVSETGEGLYLPRLDTTSPSLEVKASPDGEGREIHVSPAVLKKLFEAVPMVEGGRCETHNKNIANTGAKILRYSGNQRTAQCSYNFSDDERVNDATAAFEGIAETIRYGDRLRSKLRFDRLGLDSELDGLQDAVTGQRALDVGNIAPVLQNIINDDRVMDRVRRKAERLLQGAAPAQAADAAGSSAR